MSPETKLARRAEVKALATQQAFEAAQECPHCGGSGQIEGGRKIIHSFLNGWIGADWDLDEVLALIDRAEEVGWVNGFAGHDLAVRTRHEDPSGRVLVYTFQVSREPRP